MTCPRCAYGYARLEGEHYSVSEKGIAKVGPCEAPEDETPRGKEFPFAARMQAWRERVRAMGKPVGEAKPSWLDIAANRQEREEENDG